MRGKLIELLGALLGLCLIGWGVLTMSTAGESCGPHGMRAGDQCTTITGNHSSSTRSQDEQRSKNLRTGLIQISFGVLLAGACAWVMFSSDDKPSSATRQTPYPPQQWPPPNPPGR